MPIYEDKKRLGLPRPLSRNAAMNAVFGKPGNSKLYSAHQVPLLGKVYCHNLIALALEGAMQDVVDLGLEELVDRDDFGGCYCYRNVRGSTAMSPHSWAIAVDLNVTHLMRNGREIAGSATNFHCKPGQVPTSLKRLAYLFRRWGFSWGGDWATEYLDPMHMEASEITVAILQGKPLPAAFVARMKKDDKLVAPAKLTKAVA
jgi:hypothetical protein